MKPIKYSENDLMSSSELKSIAVSSKNVIFEDKDYVLHKFESSINSNAIHYTPKDHFIALHLCQKGSVTVTNSNQSISISEQQSLLFYDSQMQSVTLNLNDNTTSYLLQLSLANLHLLLSNDHKSLAGENIFSTKEPIVDIKPNSTEVIRTIAELSSEESNDGMRKLFLRGKIFEIISYLGTEAKQDDVAKCPFTSDKKNSIIMAKDILIKDLKSPPKIEEIATMLKMSQKKLKEDFKEMYGAPIYTYYLNYKLDLAKDLLDKNELNMSDISELIGYSTTSHFIAAFKKKYQTTPKQYQLK